MYHALKEFIKMREIKNQRQSDKFSNANISNMLILATQ